jgi:hypothetical protein
MPRLVPYVHDPEAALALIEVHVFNRLADARKYAEVPAVTDVAADHDGGGDEAVDLFDHEVTVEATAVSVTVRPGSVFLGREIAPPLPRPVSPPVEAHPHGGHVLLDAGLGRPGRDQSVEHG